MPIYYGTQKVKPSGIKNAYYGSTTVYSASRLPNTYQEVEYIESSGTQYIDTGISAKSGLKIEATVSCLASTIGYTQNAYILYGGGIGWQNKYIQGEVDWSAYYAYNNSTQQFQDTTIAAGSIVNVVHDDNKVYWNGILKATFPASSWSSSYSIYIFAYNRSGSVGEYGIYRLKAFDIYDGNTLVRNFVPCYRIADNVIGLYDLVNNTFYTNSGSGTFTKGSDV